MKTNKTCKSCYGKGYTSGMVTLTFQDDTSTDTVVKSKCRDCFKKKPGILLKIKAKIYNFIYRIKT